MKKTTYISRILAASFVGMLLTVGACKGPKGDKGDPGPQGEQGPAGPAGANGQDAFITLSTPATLTLNGARLSNNTTLLGGSANNTLQLNRLLASPLYIFNLNLNRGTLSFDLSNVSGSYLSVSLSSTANNISGVTPSNITTVMINGTAVVPLSGGGFHVKNFGFGDNNLGNPDTITVTSISYNASSGILTLNLSLQDHSGDGDNNQNAIAQSLNGNTAPASGSISIQIPVANASTRTL